MSPPILAVEGAPFGYHNRPLNPARLAEVFSAVRMDDDLIMRGLHALSQYSEQNIDRSNCFDNIASAAETWFIVRVRRCSY